MTMVNLKNIASFFWPGVSFFIVKCKVHHEVWLFSGTQMLVMVV